MKIKKNKICYKLYFLYSSHDQEHLSSVSGILNKTKTQKKKQQQQQQQQQKKEERK